MTRRLGDTRTALLSPKAALSCFISSGTRAAGPAQGPWRAHSRPINLCICRSPCPGPDPGAAKQHQPQPEPGDPPVAHRGERGPNRCALRGFKDAWEMEKLHGPSGLWGPCLWLGLEDEGPHRQKKDTPKGQAFGAV